MSQRTYSLEQLCMLNLSLTVLKETFLYESCSFIFSDVDFSFS